MSAQWRNPLSSRHVRRARRPAPSTLQAGLRGALAAAIVAGLLVVLSQASGGPAAHAPKSAMPPHSALAGDVGSPGTNWADEEGIPSDIANFNSVSCPSIEVCVAVGTDTSGDGVAYETVDGALSWSEVSVPSGTPSLVSVSCPNVDNCVAVGGGGVLYQASEGDYFVDEEEPSGIGSLESVSCSVEGTLCIATGVDDSGYAESIITSDDDGSSWGGREEVVDDTIWENWDTISCTSDNETCQMVGSGYWGPVSAETTDGGTDWNADDPYLHEADFNDISCPGPNWCLAGGLFGLDDYGTTNTAWYPESAATGEQQLGVFCVTDEVCASVGDDDPGYTVGDDAAVISVTTDDSASWSTDSMPSDAGTVFGITCAPGGGLCLAVGEKLDDGGGEILVDEGDGLSDPTVVTDAYHRGGGGGAAPSTCDCGAGEPVMPEDGDFYTSATDVSVPTYGPPLAFTRTYDAEAAQSATGAGVLGYGWTDNWDASLSVDETTGEVTLTQSNGAQATYDPPSESDDVWSCPPNEVDPSADYATGSYCAPSFVLGALTYDSTSGDYTLVDHPQTTYVFNSSGQLLSLSDAAGDTDELTWGSPSPGSGLCPSEAGSCVTVTAASGSSGGRDLVIAYSGSAESGQVTGVTGSNGQSASFSYCTTSSPGYLSTCRVSDLISASDPASRTTAYTYDAANETSTYQHDLLTMTDPAGDVLTNTYDTDGRVATQTAPGGGETNFSYTAMDETSGTGTVAVTDPDGDVTAYTYVNGTGVSTTVDPSGTAPQKSARTPDPVDLLPMLSTDGDGHQSGATYDADGNTVLSTDAEGGTGQSAYNDLDEPWCTVEPAEYLDGTRCPSSAPSDPPGPGDSDPEAGTTISYYDGSGHLLYQTDALGGTTAYAYTSGISGVPNGLQYCSVDAVEYAADVSCPAYDATHVDGTTTETFDAAGDVTSETDALGNTTGYSYNSDDELASETAPDGTETAYSYDSAGEVTEETETFASYSASTLYAYDGDGRRYCEVAPAEAALGKSCPTSPPSSPPTPSSDSYLGATITTYNANSQAVQVTNPVGGVTYTAYDSAGRVYCTVSPREALADVTCPSSPPTTAPTIGDDPYLGATITTYDALGRPVQVTNPLGGITLTAYDQAGNVTETTVESNSSTDAPNVGTTYSYDGDNRVTQSTVGTATTAQAYDPDGNVFCSVSANAVAGATYQCPVWQAAWAASPPNPISLYSSSPTSAQAEDVTTDFYDPDGRLVQSSTPGSTSVTSGGTGYTVADTSVSSYDADGRTVCTSDPTNVATWLAAHSSSSSTGLCPSPPLTTPPTSATGYTTTIYDADGQALSTTDQEADTTSYTYGPDGQVLTTTDPRSKVTTDCYYYEDGSGQCAHGAPSAGGPGDALYSTTTPDTTADPSGETTTSTYFPGGLPDTTTTPAGTTTDGYDAMGDLTSVGYPGTASGYAAPAGVTTTYNVDGTRATETDGTGSTDYSYDAAGDLLSQGFTAGTDSGLSSTTYSYTYFTTGVLDTVVYPSYGSYSDPAASYAYNANGEMASVTDWAGNEVAFSTDGDGNETSQDNEVSTSYPDGTSGTTFAYDQADQPTGAQSALSCPSSSATTLTEVVSASYEPPSGTTTAAGTSNADGQVTEDEEVYAGSSGATACSGITSYERNYSYDLDGRVTYEGASAGGSSNFSYDASSDPTEISYDTSGTLDSYDQTFDSAGEVTAQSPVSSGSSSSYSYDTLGDLSSATTGSATTGYDYDQLGETTGVSTGPVTGSTDAYNGDGLESESSGWAPPDNVDSTNTIFSVSCPSTSFCAAGDDAGHVLTWNGTSWSSSHVDGSNTIEGMSCPTTSFCTGVDNAGDVLTYNGSSWSVHGYDTSSELWSVSCSSTSDCTAVDKAGYVLYTTNGWSSHTRVSEDGGNKFDRVSCPTSTFCAEVDNAGNVVWTTDDWASGSVHTADVDGSTQIGGVSCASSSFCVAVDDDGNAITTTNGWSTYSSADIDGSDLLESVNCLSTTDCIATDVDGNVVTYSGSTWSAPLAVDSTTLRDPSCASSTFCVAGDHHGNVVGFDGTGVTQLSWSPVVASLASVVSDGTWDYVYGPAGEPVEQVNVTSSPPSANPQFLTYFPSVSSWLVTSTTGSDVAFWRYDAYGTLDLGTPGSAFGYAGQYAGLPQNANGLDNMRARQYSPQTGEFTSRDPDFAETGEAYAYAGGDPVNSSDPTGLDNCSNAYASGSTAYNRCEWLQANNGYQAPSFWSVAWNAAGAGAGGAWDYVTSPVQAVVGFAECQGSFGTCFNQNLNPEYGLLVNGQQAWDGLFDPCVSTSTEIGYALQTAQSADSTLAIAAGVTAGGEFAVGKLRALAAEGGPADLEPYGGPGGGHHVPAKSAFTGAPNYDPNEALAIPNAELERLGVSHSAITGAQMSGYRAFAATGQTLTWSDVSSIETNALIRGGMSPGMAQATVDQAIQALQQAGVSGPTRIPWGG
jgi:RHS repeat-associated protein